MTMNTKMKTLILAAGLVLAGAATPVFAATTTDAATPAVATASPALAYGFVDLEHILTGTAIAKQANDELSAKKKAISAEFDKKGAALQAEGDALMKQKSTMKQPDFEKKMNDLETRIVALKKSFAERKAGWDVAMRSTVGAIKDRAGDVVQQVAQEKGYAAIFTRDAVFIGAKNLDITEEVIARMNKDPKKIAIDWSAGDAAVTKATAASKK